MSEDKSQIAPSASASDNLIDLDKIIVYLLSHEGVFYASLISQMRKIEDKKFPFMAGVTIRNGRLELYYNPDMMGKLKKLQEKRAVLEHECLHLVMDHLTRLRSRQPQMWNIATDLAINQMIVDLPDGVVTLDKFPPEWHLKARSTAEAYYTVLNKHAPRIKMTQKKSGKCSKCGGTGKEPQQSKQQGNKGKDKQQGQGQGKQGDKGKGQEQGKGNEEGKPQDQQGQGGSQQGQNGPSGDQPCSECGGDGKQQGQTHVEVYDSQGKKTGEFDLDSPGSHDKWNKGDSPDIAEEVLKQAVSQAKEQTERSQGKLPGGLEQYIDELLKPPVIPWWVLLKKFIATKIKSGFKRSWKRPNRRFGEEQKGKLPDRKLRIIEVVDTSGSIGIEDYRDFTNEIQGIQRIYKTKVTVIECDYDIQRVYELLPNTKVNTKFKGGGGTSFVPPFKYIEKEHLRPDLVIYFTDMYGDFPSKKPPYPVLWVSVSDIETAPFGFVLPMQKHKPKKNSRGEW